MKKSIKLLSDDGLAVDVMKFLYGKLLLQANTGGGKSWAIRRIVEKLSAIVPIIILDTEGEFHTLREQFDFLLIGKGREVTADHKTASLLAQRLVKERVSAVIDMFEMSPWERETFVKNFVSAMTNAPKELWLPTLLVIDEAQTYAPEGDKTECGRVIHDAAFKFRKRNYGIIFATPRIAALSKNVISTCKNKLIGYTSLDIDVKRASAELGFSTKEDIRSLRDLDPGQFFVFGPAFTKEVSKIQIGPVQTSHGSEGEFKGTVGRASATLRKALAALADLPQAAAEEAKTIADFKSENAKLKSEITRLSRPNQQKIVEIDPKAIEKAVVERDRYWRKKVQEWRGFSDKLAKIIHDGYIKVEGMKMPEIEPMMSASNLERVTLQRETMRPQIPAPTFHKPTRDGEPLFSDLPVGEKTVLIAISQNPDGKTREHLTVQTGYKRSSRNSYISRLIARGFAAMKGERVVATDEGVSFLQAGGGYLPLPESGPELVEVVMRDLPEGEKKILEILLMHPDGLDRETLSERTGYLRSSRNAYISRLKARELVEGDGDIIRAAQILF